MICSQQCDGTIREIIVERFSTRDGFELVYGTLLQHGRSSRSSTFVYDAQKGLNSNMEHSINTGDRRGGGALPLKESFEKECEMHLGLLKLKNFTGKKQ